MSNCEKSTLYIICLLIFIASCFYVYYTINKNKEIKKIDNELNNIINKLIIACLGMMEDYRFYCF